MDASSGRRRRCRRCRFIVAAGAGPATSMLPQISDTDEPTGQRERGTHNRRPLPVRIAANRQRKCAENYRPNIQALQLYFTIVYGSLAQHKSINLANKN